MTVDELLQAYYEAVKTRQTINREIFYITRELCERVDISDADLADIAEGRDEAELALAADECMIRDCVRIVCEREGYGK